MSYTEFATINTLHENDYMIIKNHPCKITKKHNAEPGKHGAAKSIICCKDIFTNKMYQNSYGSNEKVKVPIITKKTYMASHIDGSMVYEYGGQCFQIDNNLVEKINQLLKCDKICEMRVMSSMGKEKVIECKESKD